MPVLNHCSIYSAPLASNNSAFYHTEALKEATQVVNLITESRLCNQRFKIHFFIRLELMKQVHFLVH